MVTRTRASDLTSSPLAFDHQATTPCAAEVVEAMEPYWCEQWGNPSSRQHRLGLSAAAAVSMERRTLAECLEVETEREVFASSLLYTYTVPRAS